MGIGCQQIVCPEQQWDTDPEDRGLGNPRNRWEDSVRRTRRGGVEEDDGDRTKVMRSIPEIDTLRSHSRENLKSCESIIYYRLDSSALFFLIWNFRTLR
jgi:hypothetical protein